MIIGVEMLDEARAYDLNELIIKRRVMDELGGRNMLLVSSEDATSEFDYDRTTNEETLDFEIEDDVLMDISTQSKWNLFGQCVSGERQGAKLELVQSYKQFLRAWITFHPETTFYNFDHH